MIVEWEFLNDGTMKVKSPVWDEEQILPAHIASVFKTKEMIRTQDIGQNGYSSIDIPGLNENTRWGHQIMVVQLELPFLEKVKKILEENGIEVDNEELEIAEMVFACHDVGHTDNSHQSEKILKYPHELRTTDILLGDTELGNLLSKNYPREKVESVVQIITNEGKISNEKLSPIMQLYAQLVSSGGDLDKFAYTIGDTTCAGIKSSLDPKKYLDSLGIDIDANGNYILHCSEEGQRQIEILDIERFQNYREIYFNVSDEIMAYMEPIMLELASKEDDEVKQKLPIEFLYKVDANKSNSRITTLDKELKMTDTPMKQAWQILSKEAKSEILKYLSDMQSSREDFQFFETRREFSEILAQLQEIFPNKDLSNTNSLFEIKANCKMIKQAEDPWIKSKNGDIQKASEKDGCLIKPEIFIRKRIYFNPELLRLELNMSKEEFAEYKTEIEWLLDELVQKEDEFEQKYLLKDKNMKISDFISFMKEQGFKLEGTRQEQNEDDYLENIELSLLTSGKEFRIRNKTTANGNTKRYMDYKEPIAEGEFSHRRSIKKTVKKETTIEEMKKIMEERAGEKIELEDKPFMHVSTKRTKLLFKKNGKKFCVSWDESIYNNKWLQETEEDIMLEISPRGENSDRLILKSIQQLMNMQTEQFEPYNGSKISRGANLTYRKKKFREKEENKQMQINQIGEEQELKCRFENKDRDAVIQIVRGVLESYGITPLGEKTTKLQVDEYYDTQDYMLADRKESLRVRKTGGNLEGTYKRSKQQSNVMFDRDEMNIQIQESTASALIEGIKEQYGIDLPKDIMPVVKVKNERLKQNYGAEASLIELAFDKLENTDLKTGKVKEALFGELELEFKEKTDLQKAEEMMQKIWLDILRKCSEKNIVISKSRYSKYISALIDLNIIKDIDNELINSK